jgi:hypothetical protein
MMRMISLVQSFLQPKSWKFPKRSNIKYYHFICNSIRNLVKMLLTKKTRLLIIPHLYYYWCLTYFGRFKKTMYANLMEHCGWESQTILYDYCTIWAQFFESYSLQLYLTLFLVRILIFAQQIFQVTFNDIVTYSLPLLQVSILNLLLHQTLSMHLPSHLLLCLYILHFLIQ